MFVRCMIQNCGYCSDSGFCLNRVLVINEQGICKYLTIPGWEQPVEDRFKNNYQEKKEIKREEQEKEEYSISLEGICDW